MDDLQRLAENVDSIDETVFVDLFKRLAMLPETHQYSIIEIILDSLLKWKRGVAANRKLALQARINRWWSLLKDNPEVATPQNIQIKVLASQWLSHSAHLKRMESVAFADLVQFPMDVQVEAMALAQSCIDQIYPDQQAEYEVTLQRIAERLKGWLAKPRAENWLALYLETWGRGIYSYIPPFQSFEADQLAEKVIAGDYSAYPQIYISSFRAKALERLAEFGFSDAAHLHIIEHLTRLGEFPGFYILPAHLGTLKRLHAAGRISDHSRAALRRHAAYNGSDGFADLILTPELNPGEAWSDTFLARLDNLSQEQRQPWPALMAFARTASAGKPTAKWLKEAQTHVNAVGAGVLREVLTATLPLLSRPRTFRLQGTNFQGADANLVFDPFNSLSLKGLLWLVPLVADTALTRTLPGVVETALKKVPGVGPREPKVANAAVYALSQIESGAALSALARLATTLTYKGTLNEVRKALEVVAARLNVTPDELLELGVPTLGLTAVGERIETLGEVDARLTVDADGAHLSFSRGGKPLKSVPASVKKDCAEELADLKAAQKEAEKSVAALSQRLDGLMIQPRVWPGEAWLERYLNHPLAGTVARRLIWLVDGVAVFWADGDLRDVRSEIVPILPTSEISLWHPTLREVEEVLAWRRRLEGLDIRQPFKQAWREVYVLTDAERRTDTYSNRFAGHILKQHQFHALAALRGWRNRLRLMVDDSYPPAMRDLPAYGLRAEYWIEGIGQDYGTDSTDSGTYLRLSTDQVRFYPLAAPENHAHAGGGGYEMWVNQTQQPVAPLPLSQIPPLVLSEVLRDVDLFVGVASVGNDPTWQDGGPGGRFREYWHSYSFGELAETAKTRAAYLERLIPRLKIRERLSLDGRFLRVQGDRRAYRIHLGSANILMEPNDQYLCIIPGGKNSGPDVDFDGDRVLSLVLSKAFLLADDTAITDPVILQQLGR